MPAPRKRTEELQRPRYRQGKGRDDTTYGELREVDFDEFAPNAEWDEVARMIWEAALSSGQADWYQNSDLALLYVACDELTRYRSSGKPSSMHLAEIMSILSNLLVSEGDRRKARLELQRPSEEPPELRVVAMSDYADYFNKNGTPKTG